MGQVARRDAQPKRSAGRAPVPITTRYVKERYRGAPAACNNIIKYQNKEHLANRQTNINKF